MGRVNSFHPVKRPIVSVCNLLAAAALLLGATSAKLYGVQVRVPEGTLVSLTLRFDVTTENVVKGDRVEFDVSDNVVIDDEIAIPQGARAWAMVAKVRGEGKKDAKDAAVTFHLMGVKAADGQTIPIRLMPSKSRKPGPTDNDIEESSAIPGSGPRQVGAPKGKQYAAYTDSEAFVNVATKPAAPSTAAVAPVVVTPVAEPPQPASVDFRSDPPASDVVIDGSSVGVTPMTQQLSPGLHDIEIHAKGYQNWMRKMRVEPGSHPTVMARLVPS
ncbi:MAG TPA: PEGA domain-containing protein [Terriglobia bacterium]|nr:PEGA domain-containing protein [Terriglobia bacterium]